MAHALCATLRISEVEARNLVLAKGSLESTHKVLAKRSAQNDARERAVAKRSAENRIRVKRRGPCLLPPGQHYSTVSLNLSVWRLPLAWPDRRSPSSLLTLDVALL